MLEVTVARGGSGDRRGEHNRPMGLLEESSHRRRCALTRLLDLVIARGHRIVLYTEELVTAILRHEYFKQGPSEPGLA